MRTILFLLALTSTFAYGKVDPKDYEKSLPLLQKIWKSQDPELVKKNFPELIQVTEDDATYTLGTGKMEGVFGFKVKVDKVSKKIASISLGLDDVKRNTVKFIKSKLKAKDWESTPVPSANAITVEKKVSHFSQTLGLSFIYDELDRDQKVWILYWGYDPHKITL